MFPDFATVQILQKYRYHGNIYKILIYHGRFIKDITSLEMS